jgi:hypothetical protein
MAASPLSAPSASCTLTHGDPVVRRTTASWDAAARTFSQGTSYWKLDASARVVERGATDGQWRHLMSYDDHGVTKEFVYQWEGAEVPENSWDQHNEYDTSGRLRARERVFRSGTRRTNTTYEYSGDRLTVVRDQEVGTEYRLVWRDGRLVARETTSASTLRSRQTRQFDGAGRVVQVDTDGAGLAPSVDGRPDVSLRWQYNGEGRLVRFELDGDTPLDAPVVDGRPDQIIDFDPACANIALLPGALYLLERWLEHP